VQDLWLASRAAPGTCNRTALDFPLRALARLPTRSAPYFVGQCNATLWDAVSGVVQVGRPHTLDVSLFSDLAKVRARIAHNRHERVRPWTFGLEAIFEGTRNTVRNHIRTFVVAFSLVGALSLLALLLSIVFCAEASRAHVKVE